MRPVALALALFAAALLTPADPAPGQESRSRFSAYATGTALHADAVRVAVGGVTLVDTAVAVSAASVASDGLEGSISDEMGQVVQPPAPAGKASYSRGAGLEVTLAGGTPLGFGLSLAGVAEAAAPPSPPLRSHELGPVAADPLAYASLVRGQARPVWSDRTCVIGQPTAFGLGYAADVQLINLGKPGPGGTFTQPLIAADAGNPTDRTVTQSRSFTYLKPNPDGSFALVSETRQTIAPVTLFRGSAAEVTFELLGEWVLRATASGKRGGAAIEYGPAADGGPATPVLRLLHAGGVTELTLQQLLGTGGLHLAIGPLLHVAIGEDPRPIAVPGRDVDPDRPPEASSDGTRAAAAVDVVRVSLLQPAPPGGPRGFELRLGHMEARAEVPSGGVGCGIPIRKEGTPTFVNPGDTFTWTISIPSAADAFDGLSCDLVGVSAVDTSRATAKVVFTIQSASNGGVIDGHTVRWADLGRYRPGAPPIVLNVAGRVEPDSARGVLTDTVDVTASLDNCTAGVAAPPAMPSGTKGMAVRGSFTLEGPTVLAGGQSRIPPETPPAFLWPLVPLAVGVLALGKRPR